MATQASLPPAFTMTPPTPECNVEVRPSPISGNGLFATKDIPAGSTILLKVRPLIGELDLPRLQDSCHNCFMWTQKAARGCATHSASPNKEPGCAGCQSDGAGIGVKACTGCKKVKYCSRVCQKQAWTRGHKNECKLLKDPSLPPLPSSVRGALQLASLMSGTSASEEDKSGIRRLEAHDRSTIEQYSDIEQYEVTVASARDLFGRVSPDDPEASKLRDYVGKILRNSLTLTTPTLDPMGIALDPIACSANHSCDPNASVLFDCPRLLMRSLAPIQKDEEVFISYIDNTDPYYRRQAQLNTRYCFKCECSKCRLGPNQREDKWAQSPETLSTKLLNLAALVAARFPTDPADYVGDSKAEKDLSAIQGNVYRNYEGSRNQKDNALAIKELENVMRVCKDSGVWPITRQPYANVRVDLSARMLDEGCLGLALFQMAKTYFLIDPTLYPQDFHPVRVLHTWCLAKTLVAAYSSGNDPSMTVDPGVEELFQREFDFVVPIWRILKKLSVDVIKSHGSGSNLTFMVHSLTQQVREGVGMENLREIERDPLHMWKEFERWAHYLQY
ncbi:SET domain-containing protein [Aureobasidium subglaciale]|nr:SET domain-containing protein [Aureobasidium subglaciale]